MRTQHKLIIIKPKSSNTQTGQQWLNYQQLELITSAAPDNKPESLLAHIRRYLQDIFALNNEPHITEMTRNGKTWWKVYDPATNESLKLASEQEVLVWLEERHHQTGVGDAYFCW